MVSNGFGLPEITNFSLSWTGSTAQISGGAFYRLLDLIVIRLYNVH
jgi:hypothetical protein